MKKNYQYYRVNYDVLDIIPKEQIAPFILQDVKRALKCVKDYTRFKKKVKIIFVKGRYENFGEFFGIFKKKGRIVIYLEEINNSDLPTENLIRTIMHEYLHFLFLSKKFNCLFDLDMEEKLIETIENELWQKYFI